MSALAASSALLNPGVKPARISRTSATVIAIALVALVAWYDYVTDDFSLAVFYLAPVALATWYAGRATGLFIGMLSAVGWFLANQHLDLADGQPFRSYWNAGMLALIYGIVAYLLAALERLQAELRNRVDQRTSSLAEVHHRVKNNLQVISGLLMLQGEKLTNAADKAVFDECRDRIYSMARLHEQLYASGKFSDLDFAAHLREMAEMLVRSHTPPGCVLILEVRVDPVPIDLDTAVTLGLIANELLLNSLKHALDGRREGKVTVQLHEGNPNQMIVSDDGSGLPAGFDAGNNTGLGIKLVLEMTRQIHGEATIENGPGGGISTTISFPSIKPSKIDSRRD